MRLRRSFLLVAFLLCALAMFQTVGARGSPPAGFDEYVNKALRDWEAPGLAIAVVEDDRVVFAKGYGVRKLGIQFEMAGDKVAKLTLAQGSGLSFTLLPKQ